ncbi:hypothetical protein [Streptomyces chartreusis]|uniref:hypothetical protein n=1 Tax=Streptomyces chartreusis TaxID=1969 RepID=UPI0033F21BC5
MDLLAQLFNTTATTISRAVKDVRPLPAAQGIHLPASTARFRTREDVARFLDPDKDQTDASIPGKPLELVTRSRVGFPEASPADEAAGQGDEGSWNSVRRSQRTARRLKWWSRAKVCSTT